LPAIERWGPEDPQPVLGHRLGAEDPQIGLEVGLSFAVVFGLARGVAGGLGRVHPLGRVLDELAHRAQSGRVAQLEPVARSAALVGDEDLADELGVLRFRGEAGVLERGQAEQQVEPIGVAEERLTALER
jgi:hypothetical protein